MDINVGYHEGQMTDMILHWKTPTHIPISLTHAYQCGMSEGEMTYMFVYRENASDVVWSLYNII
jgi:hypothetical protein